MKHTHDKQTKHKKSPLNSCAYKSCKTKLTQQQSKGTEKNKMHTTRRVLNTNTKIKDSNRLKNLKAKSDSRPFWSLPVK